MDKQTIQELEIIIRANCEQARKDLKDIAKETQKTANDISKSMNNVSKNSMLDNIKKEFKKGTEIANNFKKELDTIGIYKDGLEFRVKADFSDFDEQYDKALEKYNKENIKIPVEYTTNQSNTSQPAPQSKGEKIDIDTKQSVNDVDRLKEAVRSMKEEVKKLQNEHINLEMSGANPYDILSFKDSLVLLTNQIVSTIPTLNDLKQSLNQNLSGDFGDTLLRKGGNAILSIKDKFKELTSSVSQSMNSIKSNISTAFQNVSNAAAPITNIFSEAGKFGTANINKIKTSLKSISSTLSAPINKMKQFINKIKGAGDESDKTSQKGKKFGSNFGKGIDSGVKSIKKFTMALLSVRTAFSLVSKASQAYLSFDTQLNDSIQNSWNVLGSLLAPILEYVASLFSKLVNSVASFIKALSGIDLVAKANSKALDKQAKSASAASKSLAGIDDIDTLSTSSGGGGDSQTITADIDSKPLEEFANKVKELFSTIFEPFKEAWDNVGTGVFDSMTEMVSSLGELSLTVGSSLLEVWTNGTGTEIVENVLLQWQQLFDIINAVSTAITNAWKNAGTGTSIIQSIANIFKDIQEFGLLIGDSILKWTVSESFQEALNRVFTFIDDIFTYVEDICDWLLGMYDKYLKPVIDEKLLPAINDIIIAVSDIWNAAKPVINFVIGYIKSALEPAISGLCRFIGGVVDAIRGIARFLSGVFTGDWTKAWNGIKLIFKGIWDSLSSLVVTPINSVLSKAEFLINKLIDGFNSFKRAINKISIDVPDWVPVIGGKKFGFNLSLSDNVTLPRLATGNVAYEETTAVFGEYANARTNPEITSPVSLMKDSFRSVLNEFEFGGTRIDTLKIDVAGENFYQGTVDYINNETTRRGVSILKEA